MKKYIFSIIFAAAVVSLAFTSCKSVSYQARGVKIENQNIISTPTVVDIQVDMTKRVSYSDNGFVKYPQSVGKNQTEQLALNAARYACITQNNIDVVVDPVYKITFKGMACKKAKIELTGYAGYYKNARTIYDDVKSLEKYSMDDVKKYIIFNNPSLLQNNELPVNITFPNNDK